VWRFSSPADVNKLVTDDVNKLVTDVVHELSGKIVFEKGVLQGIEWCLNEVMDNVLQHSDVENGQPFGYVMAQVHAANNRVAFCICDYGQGIHKSLQSLEHAPRNAIDSISLAIQEKVTRDKNVGQGNGLWGLHNILRLNVGQLTIISGEGSWMFDGHNVKTHDNLQYLDCEHKGTIIDFQVNTQQTFSIAEALNGHSPVNFPLERIEDAYGKSLIFSLRRDASGTGTRQSGMMLRNHILNLAKESPNRIIIDFNDVSMVSSSFADELIGKLVIEFGFVTFTQRVQLINMNEIITPIVNRSVSQRIAEMFHQT
jgi:anti-sigma regulatory factor (Ser/Thr protein kinase)